MTQLLLKRALTRETIMMTVIPSYIPGILWKILLQWHQRLPLLLNLSLKQHTQVRRSSNPFVRLLRQEIFPN